MQDWHLALAVNAIVAVAYFSIAVVIGRGIHATRQWRTNPLAVATFLIFVSCAVGHATHVEHMLFSDEVGRAARQAYDPHLIVVDAVTSVIAIYYFAMRHRFPALLRGTAIFEDLTLRRRQALDIHDNIVQQLATAKMAFETNHPELGMSALERGLTASKAIITDMIGENDASDARLEPGGLRREKSAKV